MKTIKLHLVTVALNNQGYDSNGRYWGVGHRLWHYFDTEGETSGFLRSPTREVAKQMIKLRVFRDGSGITPVFFR